MNRTEQIIGLILDGKSYQEVGKIFNISRQRVWQIIHKKNNKRYNKLKIDVFNRDKLKCQWGEYCNGNKDIKLIVHHIDGNHLNDDINNLITLCTSCHSGFHGLTNKRKERKNKRFCKKCGIKFYVTSYRSTRKFCSRKCFGLNYRKPEYMGLKPKSKEWYKVHNDKYKEYRKIYYKNKHNNDK